MRQIEISNNEPGIYQTFIIDPRHDFPYYRPLFLIGRVENEKQAAKSAKNNYLWSVKLSEVKEANKVLKVIAKPANKEKDLQIKSAVEGFNDALTISSRTVSEVQCRYYEETIHQLILNY